MKIDDEYCAVKLEYYLSDRYGGAINSTGRLDWRYNRISKVTNSETIFMMHCERLKLRNLKKDYED